MPRVEWAQTRSYDDTRTWKKRFFCQHCSLHVNEARYYNNGYICPNCGSNKIAKVASRMNPNSNGRWEFGPDEAWTPNMMRGTSNRSY